jgi:hypothetical protein
MYVLSIGPYIWLWNHRVLPEWAFSAVGWIYLPFWWLIFEAPEPVSAAVLWYLDLWGGLDAPL